MGAIEIFLVVMSCSANMLFCDNMSDPDSYADMDQCHAARNVVVEASPKPGEGKPLRMAKCQYVMTGSPPDRVPEAEHRSATRPLW